MCETCGCSDEATPRLIDVETGKVIHSHVHTHDHDTHDHEHPHTHDHEHPHTHEHEHPHAHEHEHPHTHDDGNSHTHEHTHSHSHEHQHTHEHPHTHDDGHSHAHEHTHSHSHDDEHSHEHTHSHSHDEHSHTHEHTLSGNEKPAGSRRSQAGATGEPPEGTDLVKQQHRSYQQAMHPGSAGVPPASMPADNAPHTPHGKTIQLEQDILSKNKTLAAKNRKHLKERGIVSLNFVSAPGSGKTTLLQKTINQLKHQIHISVLEGDQETSNDAERIRSTGCRVFQINTGAGCHLEADIVGRGIEALAAPDGSLLIIENVGNLVCPALFDLGEDHKIVILSVTEGEDKPLKYPHMFRAADILIINKIDLLPYLEFDLDACINNACSVNNKLRIFQLSATKGDGMTEWLDWLKAFATNGKTSLLAHS